ncbi:class E sortase [Streptomyces finlayi]|uniref:class E sortase n=1 Tax=Streptomyces finlayi TaxID=67296 RepID=UPI001E29381F|nr:class E sortase [Streptomyces finlayi]
MRQWPPAPRRRTRLARWLWGAAEGVVTLGVVLLLLVVHQVWWTNREARAGAEETVRSLVREWEDPGGGEAAPGDPGGAELQEVPGEDLSGEPKPSGDRPTPRPRPIGKIPPPPAQPRWNQAYAVIRIPKIGVVAPVAQGVGKRGVLDKGYVGHYPGTAAPGRAGNFALAGHRNTHGEPFRYINRLGKGDEVVVETRAAVYTYVVSGGVPQTSPRDVGVIDPVPRSAVHPGRGFGAPGYYLTLTTCTPEFTSTYRLVIWATLARMAPK